MFLIVLLALPLVGALSAQEAPAATATETTGTETTVTAATATEAAEEETTEAAPNSYDLRSEFSSLVSNSSPELGTILALRPDLLANEEFMAGYPEVARFLAEHPEVSRRSGFFLAKFNEQTRSRGPVEQILEPLMALLGFIIVALALIWIVRTAIEQRRWTRLTRTQTEVHNKILDRFGSSAELLEYIRTPAGTKFLESAPIELRPERVQQHAPLSRVMLSIQAGVIVAAGGIGMLLVSTRYPADSGQGLFALGAIALCVGAGFIASALVTIFLSRRFGLWPGEERVAGEERGA
jgi:hypothetical protein